MDEIDAYNVFQGLNKYLEMRTETSRGVVTIKESTQVPLGQKKLPDKMVKYDCHDIQVTINNTFPVEHEWPTVVFTGIALFLETKSNQNVILQRWHNTNLPKVDLKNSSQNIKDIPITDNNYFPRRNQKYFPKMTEDEAGHGYFLFPGQSIVYEMNVLLAECFEISDIDLHVEATISRRHLFHFSNRLSLKYSIGW
jgi:hypothetical protein